MTRAHREDLHRDGDALVVDDDRDRLRTDVREDAALHLLVALEKDVGAGQGRGHLVDDLDIGLLDRLGARFGMLQQAGDEEVVCLEPDALHPERAAEYLCAVYAVLERDTVEYLAIEKSGSGGLARQLACLLDVERGDLLVGASDDRAPRGARLVERDAAHGEEAGSDRYARTGFGLPLGLSDARRHLLLIDDVAVPEPLALGESGADDAQLAPALLIAQLFDHHQLDLVGADVDSGGDATGHE